MKRVSLLWKILFSTSLALTLLFGAMGWVGQNQFVRIASQSLQEEVRSSFQAYESLWRARAQELASVSLVLSRMSDIRAAFSTRDAATIRDTAGEVWDKIARRGALFLVTDPDGAVLAAVGGAAPNDFREIDSVKQASAKFPAQAKGFIFHNGQLFQIVVTPVYVAAGTGSALLNVLVAGVVVDTEMVRDLKQATGGSDFVFLSQGKVIASSLPQNAVTGDYAHFETPLLDVKGQPVGELRILRSFDAARNRISSLRTTIVALWAVGLLAGLLLTYFFARRLLEPVHALDRAAAEIAKGNYDVTVPIASEDEIGRLTRTFNSMCASLRNAREELIHSERIATISRLSTSIVHDLRNPLASIYGGSEMLVDDDLSPVQVKRLAANIYNASRRMQELLRELADVRITGRPHVRELCRLREVIEAACEMVATDAAKYKIDVRVDVPADIEAPLDRSPMERVFQNLLSNAIEAMPEGGWLRIWADRSPSEVRVYIEDNGPGIPASIAPSLFKPFVTAGKKNGLGLGLAFSRETMLEHGGDLSADPAPERGARFVLRLPLSQAGTPQSGALQGGA
jgi:signal transduction histidine kinase